MAFGWIGATIALASVVRNPNSSCSPSIGALLGPRTPRQGVHRPAKANSGRSSLSANQMGVLRGLVSAYSQNDVAGTTQRLAWPEPSAPVRASDVADVRDRRAAELRRSGHAPARHDKLALAVRPVRTIGASWSGKIPETAAGCRCDRAARETNRGSRLGLWSDCRGCTWGGRLRRLAPRPQNSFLSCSHRRGAIRCPMPDERPPARRPTRVHRPGADERRPFGESAVGRTDGVDRR